MRIVKIAARRTGCIRLDLGAPILLTYEVDHRILSASTFSYD